MRKWGVVVSAFYAVILLVLLVPVFYLLAEDRFYGWAKFFSGLVEAYGQYLLWVLIVILLSSQVLLLFLSVDTSLKRLKPRAHVLTSVVMGAVLTALLSCGVIWSLGIAIGGDRFPISFSGSELDVFGWLGALWLLWGIVFYQYFRNSSEAVTRIISWLLKGSILELLVAVPCHVVVRRRHECSAPIVTSFGIVTGIAIMLLSFGPSVLFLYKKRLDAYSPRSTP